MGRVHLSLGAPFLTFFARKPALSEVEGWGFWTSHEASRDQQSAESFYYWRISAATSSPNFFWIYFWVSGSKSVISNIRRTSTVSLSFPGMREAHSSASSRDFTWMIQ